MWLELANFLHFIGLAFGLGGATIASIVSAKAEKDKELGKQIEKILPSIVKLIWIGMALLIVSGIALPFFISWPLNTNLLIIKHVLVAWIIVVGIFLGINSKKMMKFAQEKNEKGLLKSKKTMKILSMIDLLLWYTVTLMSAFV